MLSKIFLCPADKKYGCTWEGSSCDIFEHFSQEHEDLLFLTGLVTISLELTSENRLLLVDTEIYLLQTKIEDECLNMYLRYLGPSKIAEKLTYDINIFANGVRLGKQDISAKEGCFCVSLECIRASCGNVDVVSCQLLVSGDFSASSSEENVFLKDDNSSMDVNISISRSNDSKSSSMDNLSLQSLFSTPINRQKKFSFDETNVASSHKRQTNPLLTRSQTFTSEDIKRNNMRRQASMRSLSSISESDLDSDLKCSNCEGHLVAPIFLCITGHNVCAACYQNKNSCTVCSNTITSNRNQDLEGKSVNYTFCCVNKKNGCPERGKYREIVDHEVSCIKCQYLCPVEGCGVRGVYRDLVNHLSLIHSSIKMSQSLIAEFQKYKEHFLADENRGIFYCSWSQFGDKVIWKVKLCGPKSRKFFCELKFKGKNLKEPLLLTKYEDYYYKELTVSQLKALKVKVKNSFLTVIR